MKRIITIVTSVTLSLAVWQGVATATTSAARTTSTVTWAQSGPYACVGPCATATYYFASGTVRSKNLGTMKDAASGTVLHYNAATKCLIQSEHWAFTTRNEKDTIYFSTTSDTYCFTADPNVSIEKGTFKITGGKGRFAKATGSGTFRLRVLGHPQTGAGTITMTITY